MHIIFSTKNREPLLNEKFRSELFSYVAGAHNNLDSPPIEIGGEIDHIHILCLLSKNLALSKLVEKIKTSSSKWLKTKSKGLANFHWQNGYGAFSVSESNVSAVQNYIREQDQCHRKLTFQDEFRRFLKKYRVPYNEHYIWD